MNTNSDVKIPFGLKDGVLVHVSDVMSGLKCGCICPACPRKLQANKGTKKTHYFSHDPLSNTDECKSAFETSIHLMAKQILAKHKNAIFPLLELSMSMKDCVDVLHTEKLEVTPKTKKDFINVVLEKRLEGIRPDIIAYTSSQVPILIEVAVTNFSDAEKKKIIRGLGLYAIEIDLSGINYQISEDELTKLVIEEFKNKKWLSNPDAITAKIELSNRLKKKIDEANQKIKSRLQAYYEKPHIKVPNVETSITKLTKISRQYDQRWFCCKACKHLFDKSAVVAPYTLKTIECPKCGCPVSTATA
jgi:hypothetical protein